MYIFIGTD